MPTPNFPEDGIPTLRGQPWLGAYFGSQEIYGARRLSGLTAGNIYFVDSGHSLAANDTANGRRPDYPFRSMHYADTQCSASNGDIVFVMPGHTETVSAAAGCDLNTAGVTWVGLGVGPTRPTINFTTATTADLNIDGAGITMINFLFIGVVDALVAPLDVNASDFSLLDCEYRDTSATQVVDFLLTDANASRMLVNGFTYRGDTAAGTNSAIAIVGGDGITIQNCSISGDFAVGAIDIRTTATTNLTFRNSYVRTLNSADIILIDTITGSTGSIGPNLFMRVADNAANITEAITGATFVYFGSGNTAGLNGASNLVVNLAGEAAMTHNAVQSTDA